MPAFPCLAAGSRPSTRTTRRATATRPKSAYTAVGYDAVKIVEAGVLASGALGGAALRDAIDGLENMQGAVGIVTYKSRNRVPLREVSLTRVTGGEREYIDQFVPDTADLPTGN